jgi:peroxiredoxin
MKTKAILLTMLLAISGISLTGQVKIGDQAPDFKLKNIDNKWVSLNNYDKEKGVVVVFTCNHCPYAKMYESRLVDLQAKYGKMGFPIIAINSNDSSIVAEDSFSKMKSNAVAKGFNFPYVLDNIGIYQKYGATKTPHVFLLKNESNAFTVNYIGAIDDNPQDAGNVKDAYLAQAIEALLEGKKPPKSETKAIGCSIKQRK